MDFNKPQPISKDHILDYFCSGVASLDDWLKKKALNNHESGASRVYVVTDKTNKVVAYYCLSTSIVLPLNATGKFRRNMPSEIPVILLGRLAVDQLYKGRGFGRGLLKDAAQRVLLAAEIVGVRGMTVHALSNDVRTFYTHIGFSESPIDPMFLMISLKELKANI